jgi:ferric-dicitrate binding protein FerR (iron transport regulator)
MNKRISLLILDELKGEINNLDKQELNSWLKNPENLKQYKNFRKIHGALEEYKSFSTIDLSKAEKRFKANIKTKSNKKRGLFIKKIAIAVASVVLLLISVNQFFLGDKLIDPKFDLSSNEVQIIDDRGNIFFPTSLPNNDSLVFEDFRLKKVDNKIHYIEKRENEKLVHNYLYVPKGKTFEMVLPDQSKIWVNSNTQMRFTACLGDSENRNVWLKSGEIFLDVFHNKEKPFYVNAKETVIKVLGTKFNVSSYDTDKYVAISLEEGKILVTPSEHSEKKFKPQYLFPGNEIKIDNTTKNVVRAKVPHKKYKSWIKGQFHFKNKTIEEILKVLARNYNYKLIINDDSIKDIVYSCHLYKKSDILTLIKAFNLYEKVNIVVNSDSIFVGKK